MFIFSLFLLVWIIKRYLEKKYGVTGLVFKIDAIAGRKWVKFVAMQQNNIFLEVTYNNGSARFVDNRNRKEDGNFYATMNFFYSLNAIMLFSHTCFYFFCVARN